MTPAGMGSIQGEGKPGEALGLLHMPEANGRLTGSPGGVIKATREDSINLDLQLGACYNGGRTFRVRSGRPEPSLLQEVRITLLSWHGKAIGDRPKSSPIQAFSHLLCLYTPLYRDQDCEPFFS